MAESGRRVPFVRGMIEHAMRLFLGIELPDTLRTTAARTAAAIRERLAHDAPGSSLRWVPPENLHITVWFLGEVRDDRYDLLAALLAPALNQSPFTLRLGSAGTYPESGPPRTLWLGVREGAESLRGVYRELEGRLVPRGFQAERRPYSPHLTIGRVKDARRSDGPAIRAAVNASSADIGGCTVRWVSLFRSRTLPTGSQYEHLLRVPLE